MCGTRIARSVQREWGFEVMIVAGTVILLLIVGLFLQALTMSPRNDSEWQIDTDSDLLTTPQSADNETPLIAA